MCGRIAYELLQIASKERSLHPSGISGLDWGSPTYRNYQLQTLNL